MAEGALVVEVIVVKGDEVLVGRGGCSGRSGRARSARDRVSVAVVVVTVEWSKGSKWP